MWLNLYIMGSCRPSVGHSGQAEKFPCALKSHRMSPVGRAGSTQLTQNVCSEPRWDAAKSQRDELMGSSTFPTSNSPFKNPTVIGKNTEPRLPGWLHTPGAAPCRFPRAGFQDGTGMLCPAQVGAGLPVGTCTQGCTHTRAQSLLLPLPALQLGSHCPPAEIQQVFVSIQHPAAPLLRVQLCKGVTGRGET